MATRDVLIAFRVTERESEKIRRDAAKAGMSVSAYLRVLALHSGDLKIVTIDTEPLRELRNEVHKHGVNLNQMMHFLNTYGLDVFSESQVVPTLESERDAFIQIRAALQSLTEEARTQNVTIRLEPKSEPVDEEDPEQENGGAEETETEPEHRAKHMAK